MTERTLTPSQLPQLVPTILAGHHVVALTPASNDASWAARATWMLARAAASSGRRVLLVDLGLQGASLDDGANNPTGGGIAEAFSSNRDLQDFVAEQEVAGLHYIGRGTQANDLGAVWSSDRWTRLARGFASEDALLLLAAPPAALAALEIADLAIIVIAPEGFSATSPTFPGITNRLAAGTPLLGVIVREPRPRPSQPIRRPSGARPRPRRNSRAVTGIVGAIAVIVVALMVLSRNSGTEPARAMARRDRTAPATAAMAGRDNPADSLFYSVQVAAHNTLAQAMSHAGEIERLGHLAVVSPTRTGNQGIWYRVLVGALPTARAADSLLQTLWRDGTLERPQGTILRTPDTYRLRASREDLPGLRAQGIPAYIVLSPDKTDLVYVGAFDLAEQASNTDSLLSSAHLAGTLVRRTGSSQ